MQPEQNSHVYYLCRTIDAILSFDCPPDDVCGCPFGSYGKRRDDCRLCWIGFMRGWCEAHHYPAHYFPK